MAKPSGLRTYPVEQKAESTHGSKRSFLEQQAREDHKTNRGGCDFVSEADVFVPYRVTELTPPWSAPVPAYMTDTASALSAHSFLKNDSNASKGESSHDLSFESRCRHSSIVRRATRLMPTLVRFRMSDAEHALLLLEHGAVDFQPDVLDVDWL
ncbi:hypothetical protein H257_03865 [Aphanomyces astaci]|uniref:Uncharacterized protein n=1 Tax=Aphanomyces astaci TaxID=112090 RepID=W4GYM3_APHAT|nr:hypothetical protein H257_03865 [Aphanomyces astaci]ETV84767.1 hypothetical protein H257_03865 [Aphanomyces astaci]|eukprot:XP_009826459.1 hypothetical protein H257_03865 [Aphanomyces astaci]